MYNDYFTIIISNNRDGINILLVTIFIQEVTIIMRLYMYMRVKWHNEKKMGLTEI